MPPKKNFRSRPLSDSLAIKNLGRHIRQARSYWYAHAEGACRSERMKALALEHSMAEAERARVPFMLREWLHFRSRKAFGRGSSPTGRGR